MRKEILVTDEFIRCEICGTRATSGYQWFDRCEEHRAGNPGIVGFYEILIEISSPPCKGMAPDATCMRGEHKGSVCPFWEGEQKMSAEVRECEHYHEVKGDPQ